jgi:ABC-2 type transport system permease protein
VSTVPVQPQLQKAPMIRSLADFYVTMIRTQIQYGLQYRAATWMYTVGMVAEPVIYLVVWSTIARSQGGAVSGITAHEFAAYYIVWTFVRTMNIVLTPYAWEERIREGQLSAFLLRPMHPLHSDVAQFAGGKVIWIVLYLPIAVALTLIFKPTFSVSGLDVVVFLFAIWGAYLIRTMLLWLLGLISIWTTRASAAFETFILAELLLSGRLVPLKLMPHWAQTLAAWLPFKWTFYFPIEALVGNLSTASLLTGIGMQILWTAIGVGLVVVCFRASVKHYSAVGN